MLIDCLVHRCVHLLRNIKERSNFPTTTTVEFTVNHRVTVRVNVLGPSLEHVSLINFATLTIFLRYNSRAVALTEKVTRSVRSN